MKEAANVSVKSAVERERTKMRERLRRSITTNIFHGLRKQGGYRLSPRADINEVLRHLAHEAGWIVDSDGTTYRNPNASNGNNVCHLCGGAGDCSATASPRRESAVSNLSSGGSAVATSDALLAVYMRGSARGGGGGSDAANGQQELCFLREAGVSNQNPPAGSP